VKYLLHPVVAAVFIVAAAVGAAASLSDLPAPPSLSTAKTTIRRGDTWERVLDRAGLDRPAAAAVLERLRREPDLRRLRPKETLEVVRADDGRLLGMTYRRSLIERFELRPAGAVWTVERVDTPVETRVAAVAGRVTGSLFATMDRLGETPQLTTMFVSIFESEFDFAADSLPGDRFRLLVEKQYARGRFAGYGKILIAQYQSEGRRRLTGVAFDPGRGKTAYYDAEGRSVQKMFLRAPLDFTRITSGYSHARRHPILGGVRPHLAVDYAAPLGTPVRAVADGVVIYAGWDRWNGVTITIRHARGYETVYNHLSRVHVRRNERVRQRQLIGRVGSTGLSTGPHLDYRVVKSGVFVNPLAEKFVPGQELPSTQRPAFTQRFRQLLERLDQEAALRS
jgi:murein DD-endopeptidase MepM/ murein hydrolase activator NlpD